MHLIGPGADGRAADDNDGLYCAAYVSRAVSAVSRADVQALVTQARQRNELHGVTGFLVFQSRLFFQLVEGPRAGVEQLLARIALDSRHTDMVVVLRQHIATRQFDNWSMHCVDPYRIAMNRDPCLPSPWAESVGGSGGDPVGVVAFKSFIATAVCSASARDHAQTAAEHALSRQSDRLPLIA